MMLTTSPARLPVTLILLFVALVAGVVIWITLADPEFAARYRAARPHLNLALADKERAAELQLAAKRRQTVEKASKQIERKGRKSETRPTADNQPPPPMPKLRPLKTVSPLAAAPDPELIHHGPAGPLPKIGKDGRKAWRVYGLPFNRSDKRARIAIVITGLGLNRQLTISAIQGLPGAFTLSFIPYADKLDNCLSRARAGGHEVLLEVPMEPTDYPARDPGPRALFISLAVAQNLKRLEWVLSRATGYVGVTNYMGSRFAGSRRHLKPVLEALRSRGLLYLDGRGAHLSPVQEIAVQIGAYWASSSIQLDHKTARLAIDLRLKEAAKMAKGAGQAIAMGRAYPVTLERVPQWIDQLNRDDFVLAPVSALVRIGNKKR